MTIFLALETDGVPKPSEFELEALDRRVIPTPLTRCGFNYYVKLRNINGTRPQFHKFVEEQGLAGQTLTLWRWDTLREVFDAQDERETLLDARYAGASW